MTAGARFDPCVTTSEGEPYQPNDWELKRSLAELAREDDHLAALRERPEFAENVGA